MRTKNIELIIETLIIFSGIIAAFFLGSQYQKNDHVSPWNILSQPDFNEIGCANLTLENTAKCLHNEQLKWYKYNISKINETNMQLKELKEGGGVCYHYSKWYYDNFKRLGFKAKEISIIGDPWGHRFTIAWDNTTSYCLLDQISEVKCVRIR